MTRARTTATAAPAAVAAAVSVVVPVVMALVLLLAGCASTVGSTPLADPPPGTPTGATGTLAATAAGGTTAGGTRAGGTTPDVTPTPTGEPTGRGALPLAVRVAGNRLVDAAGTTVRLLGVNRSGTQYACVAGWGVFDGPADAGSIAAMRRWGITAVRVSLNEDCWLGINGVPPAWSGPAYRDAIGGYVARLNAAGLYVVLDLHWNAPGSTRALDQQPMADRDHAPAFWASVGRQFRSRPGVLFDLYNEPYPDHNRDTTAAWTCVRDGGTCPGVPFVAAGSQELLDAVRAAGAHNVVLVGGPQYAGVLDRWAEFAPVDPLGQLAASLHVYYGTPAAPEWSPCFRADCWSGSIAPLSATTPVVIGEVGEHDCGSALMMPLLRWADSAGVSYLAWSWLTGRCAAEPALITGYDGTPSGAGAGLRDHLLGLPH